MSQENVETVRRAYEAFSRGGLDALLEHFHADIEYDATAAIGPFAGMYYGRAAVRNFLADYFESWEHVRMEPEDFVEVGEDHVVVPVRLHTRGKGSGIDVQAQTINVWTVRDGNVVRLAIHNERDGALEAAGMWEQDAHADSLPLRDTAHAMSENAEVVRRGYDAINRGDLDAFLQALDPGIEWHLPESGLNVGIRRGHEAIRGLVEDFLETWDDFRMEPERFFERADQVVVFVRIRGRGKGSGVEIENRAAHVGTVRSGKVVRLVVYPERAQALEAVGLSEQEAHSDS